MVALCPDSAGMNFTTVGKKDRVQGVRLWLAPLEKWERVRGVRVWVQHDVDGFFRRLFVCFLPEVEPYTGRFVGPCKKFKLGSSTHLEISRGICLRIFARTYERPSIMFQNIEIM